MKKVGLILFLFCSIISSATITSNIANGNWNSGSSWSGGVVPTNTDDVIIRSTDTITINVEVTNLEQLQVIYVV